MGLISKHFITIGRRQVHYLRSGTGPALLLLHTSPLSSVSLTPMIEALSDSFTVIAPDAAGHGLTSPLDGVISSERLADGLASLINNLDLEKPMIVGVGSGAHTALVFAVRHGIKAANIICLDMPVWNEREIKKLKYSSHAFMTPSPDGSHLIRRWHALRHRDNTSKQCQEQFTDMLCTTSPLIACDVQRWLSAYIGKALHIVYDETKPVAQFADRIATDIPITSLAPDALCAHIKSFIDAETNFEVPEPQAVDLVPPPYVTRAYTQIDGQNIIMHGRAGTPGGGSLLLLHEPGFSAAEFVDFLTTLKPDITILAPDMPAEIVKPAFIAECLDMLPDDAIIVARGGGAALALDALAGLDRAIGGLILDEPLLFEEDMSPEAKDFIMVPAKPSVYGEHLLALYGRLRDRAHFWPWHSHNRIIGDNQEDALRLKYQLIAALHAGKKYQKLFRYVCESNIRQQITEAPYPLVILCQTTHPTARELRRLCQQAEKAIMLEQTGAEGVMAAMVGLGVR